MDEEHIHEPDNGTQYWDREGFQRPDQMQYNAAYPSAADGFAWSIQTDNEVLSYAYSPPPASDAMPPAPNPFQPALSPNMFSLRFAAASPIVPSNPSQSAEVLPDTNNKAAENNQQPLMSPPPPRTLQAPAARRSKYAALDWDHHRKVIQKLYLDEEKPLEEVMMIMSKDHSFNAP